MREILFKAKRLDNGEWVEGYYIYHIKRTPCVFGDSVKPEDEQHVIMQDGFSDWNMPRDTVHYDIDQSTICQYTGLTDKNGRKIWENDIVRYNSGDDLVPCAVVKYGMYDNLGNMDCYLGFYMDWLDNKSCLRRDIGFWVKNRDIEVIGNVFDNPELLEKAR